MLRCLNLHSFKYNYLLNFQPVLIGAPLQLGAQSARLVRLWVNPALPPQANDGFVIFGEESVSRLAKQFGLSTRAAVEAFRNYKLEAGKPELELKRLFAAAETFPGSSAECERGFSMMNETVPCGTSVIVFRLYQFPAQCS